MAYIKYLARLVPRLLMVTVIIFLSLPMTPAQALPVDYFFTLAILPDTQWYSVSNPAIFNSMTSYLVAQKNALNLQYVMHMGDLVEDSTNTTQFANAQTAMAILTAGGG